MRSPYPNPRALTLPLRDLMRGMTRHGGPAGAIISQALEGLPGPLRRIARDITPFTPDTSSLSGPLPPRLVAEAAAAMKGADISATRMATCTGFAISIMLAEADRPDLLVSETLLAMCWHDAETRPDRAAAFLHAMVRRDPIGVAPGLVAPIRGPDADLSLRICIGTVLWLLAEPGDGTISEQELVRISGWLGAEIVEACQTDWHDTKALNAILIDASGRV